MFLSELRLRVTMQLLLTCMRKAWLHRQLYNCDIHNPLKGTLQYMELPAFLFPNKGLKVDSIIFT